MATVCPRALRRKGAKPVPASPQAGRSNLDFLRRKPRIASPGAPGLPGACPEPEGRRKAGAGFAMTPSDFFSTRLKASGKQTSVDILSPEIGFSGSWVYTSQTPTALGKMRYIFAGPQRDSPGAWNEGIITGITTRIGPSPPGIVGRAILFLIALLQGEPKCKCGAMVRRIFRGNLAAVFLRNLVANRKPQSQAAGF